VCGIYGAVSRTGTPLRSPERIAGMERWLRHRGPDGHGFHRDDVALIGSRRLSIIDLSEEANQPFSSPDGSLWLVCNGEIYNAPALRRRYATYPFRSRRNDVESLLPLFLEHGDAALERIEGMFGLALYDARRRRLLLARDRAGEKSLFYAERAGELRFASEIQALLATETGRPEVSTEGLADYLTLGYCAAPRTLVAGIEKLEAGHLLVADADGVQVRPYWDPCRLAAEDIRSTPRELLAVFERAVSRQVASDVPLGVFTSGGLDSSLLAAEAVRHLPPGDVHTYSVRFEHPSYDESDWALHVCRELGTVHHTVPAGDAELFRALGTVSERVAEPLGDPAILPTVLLSECARRDVKVILSGEGADELFGGYPTYLGHRWAERLGRLPAPVRIVLRGAAQRLPVSDQKVSLTFLARRFAAELERPVADRHLAWFGALGPEGPRAGVRCKGSAVHATWSRLAPIGDPVKRVMVFDFLTYLAENLLTKVDRATMLSSVEARAPFLDREVMEWALRQPLASSVGSVRTKLALKRAAEARLPRTVVHRRKRGLSVPVTTWINDGLRGEFDRLLDPERLARQELLEPQVVARLLAEHRERRADHARRLWPLFVLQRWHERWIEHPPEAPPDREEQRLE
jgi:asparagine synthase (glutamine-hydrolysing)